MSLDKLIAFIPVLAVALAITFDSGYFWAIDINFFTLFSLSEHLVFAIEAIPDVLGVMAFCSLFLPLLFWLIPDIKHYNKWTLRASSAVLALIFAYLVWRRHYLMIELQSCIVALLLGALIVRRQFPERRRESLIGLAVGSAFLMSFTLGFSIGHFYLHVTEFHPHSILLKESTAVVGRIVRSGERGILFVESEGNTLQFYRLDQVISISSLPTADAATSVRKRPR
jgi:hypothetical protein